MQKVSVGMAAAAGRGCAGMKKLDSFQTKEEALDYIQENVYGCAQRNLAEKYLREKLPKESYYQDKIISFLKKTYPKGVVWKEAAGSYSYKGIPDVTFILDGRYYGFEIKRPFLGVLSRIQEQTIKKIREAGGIAEVVTFPDEVMKIVEGNRYAIR